MSSGSHDGVTIFFVNCYACKFKSPVGFPNGTASMEDEEKRWRGWVRIIKKERERDWRGIGRRCPPPPYQPILSPLKTPLWPRFPIEEDGGQLSFQGGCVGMLVHSLGNSKVVEKK